MVTPARGSAVEQHVDLRPAGAVEGEADGIRLVAQDEAEQFALLGGIGHGGSAGIVIFADN